MVNKRINLNEAAVIAGYKAGATIRELAARHHCSTGKIHQVVTAAGVSRSKTPSRRGKPLGRRLGGSR